MLFSENEIVLINISIWMINQWEKYMQYHHSDHVRHLPLYFCFFLSFFGLSLSFK